ncbi:MAG: SEC10/PgrA surface exclusion domain-containing protein [Streptococcus orisratti]|uniref:SEC10/PgrA surface exclusion domain-containing protein n=1 Tax=Streptococcus orisratti TaxID=114652 RepID=UPI002A91290D|nr:SEC10/PgrA surface exclusion domain-containing protein [Streptococcus orisratti]MDY5635781.1 SEC10/PgrA surface exclusion domain-containing protein [Streptococcus orisratti]
MAKSKFKSLAATTAITLATVGTPAFAEEVTPTIETTNDAVVSTNETTAVELPKAPNTSADVKPALDAQQAVVDATATEASQAQADADAANQAVTTAEADVATATEAVSEAEANAANATPENIDANQADQAANLADQEANATETDEVNAEIASQTETVADAQTAVDTAQAEKDAADADVTAAEDNVKSAQDAISGTGLAEAQANLDQAKADVQNAETNVATATDAVATAKQADADRQTKIDAATTDVAVKTDAVNTSKAVLTKAQDDVASTTDKLNQTTDAVNDAQDALANIDTVTIADLTQFKADKAEGDSDFMTDSGATAIKQSSTTIGNDDKTKIVDFTNITKEQAQELALYNLQVVNAIRKQLGLTELELNTGSMKAAQNQMDKYVARNKNISTDGHLPGDYFGENAGPIALAKYGTSLTMADVKQNIYDLVMTLAFADAPSNWGHSNNIQKQVSDFGASFGIIAGELYSINVFGIYTGNPITNPEDPTVLQAALVQAQADQAQAQAASDAAKAQLTKASSDYATALEVKTAAEKVLADATATPLQTQVAENNLRLAKIALTNAQTRQADAQQAVDNFSADLATKKAALDDAKAKLADAQAVQASKATALDAAKAELTKQEATLASLNAEKEALLAEKDRLVEEAKALATELKGYLEAGTKLEEAKADLSEKEATLKEAIAKVEVAHNALKDLSVKLAEEESKLAELQAEYDRLKDLEDKAKNNTIVTLPDGSVIAVPKDAPTVDEKPVLTLSTKKADTPTKTGNNTNQAGITVTQTASGEKVTYSRVARAKALPQTGEQESLLALFGVAVLSSLGLTGARRKRRG